MYTGVTRYNAYSTVQVEALFRLYLLFENWEIGAMVH